VPPLELPAGAGEVVPAALELALAPPPPPHAVSSADNSKAASNLKAHLHSFVFISMNPPLRCSCQGADGFLGPPGTKKL
jgi:hypothetical protein